MLGDGPLRRELEAEVTRRSLGTAVSMPGQVPHDALPSVLRSMQLIALPSQMPGETFPLSLLEGMATGLPALGSRWFGIPDIIEHEVSGWLVAPGDVAGIVAVLERLLLDPALCERAGAHALLRVRRHFTAEAVCAAYRQLYVDALSERRRGTLRATSAPAPLP